MCNYTELNSDLTKVSVEALEGVCDKILNSDEFHENECTTEIDKLINLGITIGIYRNREGRLVLPALWNDKVLHRLPTNYKLAISILKSFYKKYKNCPEKIKAYDDIIQLQLKNDIIEVVDNINELESKSKISYIAHNGVYKEKAESTKCRIVLLSNICEKGDGGNLSHNQVSLPGPKLNSSIVTTLTLYRFNKYLFVYDLEKAFLMLCLRPEDANKLLFLWYNDITNGDRSIITYKFKRVPFGLRFSPYLLMISLYIILILHVTVCSLSEMWSRQLMYNLAYMDNIAFSSSNETELFEAYETSQSVFKSYGFNLQQYATNNLNLEKEFEQVEGGDQVKLFGISWNRTGDTINPNKLNLNSSAKSKREIIQSINSNFDPLGIALPLMNRAKIFLHDLQLDKTVSWDSTLNNEKLHQWRKICKQINSSDLVSVPRYVGDYQDEYDLIAFTDASKDMYGCVLYLRNKKSDNLTFILSKNRMINKKSSNRTIPVLELIAIEFGVESLCEVRNQLVGAFCPISIINLLVFTDSTISLNWLHSKCVDFQKIERKSVLINNTLDRISAYCENCPVHFSHISGCLNPADFVTRCVSWKQLRRSNFLSGPEACKLSESYSLVVPIDNKEDMICMLTTTDLSLDNKCVVDFDKFSSFGRLCRVVHYVRKFAYNLLSKLKSRNGSSNQLRECTFKSSRRYIIHMAQVEHFREIFEYFYNNTNKMPSLINQLNLNLDNGILRVKGKMKNLRASYDERFPILLNKNSKISSMIIEDLHKNMRHAGVYKLLSVLRREFWIPSAYITVKKVVKSCIKCNKLYGRSIKVNQSPYKDYRVNPSNIPFRDISLDHIGPFTVKNDLNENTKVYILILTCLWSRGVNLLLCKQLNNESFLQSLQMHVFEYGIPQTILSDNGSPIVSSLNMIKDFLKDSVVKNYLIEQNIKVLDFCPYPPNSSFLGGTVEALVKQVKNIIFAAISRNILPLNKFEFLVCECKMLINKRPIAFKPLLIDPNTDISKLALTPEMLIKGYEVPSIAIVPQLHSRDSDTDGDYINNQTRTNDDLYTVFESLREVRRRLIDLYYDDFLANLRQASISSQDRYKRVNHQSLQVDDLVAIKQKFTKPYFYPTGLVTNVESNDLNEVVAVSIRKSNGEIIRRHVSELVLLHRQDSPTHQNPLPLEANTPQQPRPQRPAAVICKNRLRNYYFQD